MKTKITSSVVLFLAACAGQSSAQPAFDSSGDGQLNGNYYMRWVYYHIGDQAGDISESINIQGEITFTPGSGTYSFTGSVVDCTGTPCPAPKQLTTTGTYVISASGEGYLSAIDPNLSGDLIIGLVSQGGIFVGSSTENTTSYSDLFIAAPISSTPASNATLNGSYAVAYFDPTFPGDAFFTATADGNGNIGTVNVTGYIGTNTAATTQTLSNVTYSFTNGAAQLSLGGNRTTALVAGTEVLYVSPDGNFVFGGSAVGLDIFVGVRAATSNPTNYDGLYYQAGLDLNESSSSGSVLDSYFGSLNALSQNIIGHQRVNTPVYGGSIDFTYYDTYTLSTNNDGSSTDTTFGQQYWSSKDGTIRIGYGIGPFLSLNVAFQPPAFSGSGVYLSPVGVVNAASSAPFTAFLSPGEFLTLYGTGLAPATNSAVVPFPTTAGLSGVQVLINQIPAPVYYVSPTQISVIVPYIASPNSIAQIQVVNNGAKSNIVTQFTGLTSAGIFTNNPVGGDGIAASERPDYSIVSSSNPAHLGDTISLYVAGMGAVTNQPADGAAAPSSPLSMTTNTPTVFLYDANGNCPTDSTGSCVPATLTFYGLAPGYAGLYQLNVTIPSGLASGNATVEVLGPDSDNFEAILPLTTAPAAATPAARAQSPHQRTPVQRHRLPAAE